MMTLLAASFDQGIESFQVSVRMRRATSRRNALTSSPLRAANETWTAKGQRSKHSKVEATKSHKIN